MDKRFIMPLLVVVLVLIAAIVIVAFVPLQNGLLVKGVLITSEGNPIEVFPEFAENETFIISPLINEKAKSVDHQMLNGLNLFQAVFIGNGHKAIQVFRVYNDEGNFIYCLTNYGNVTRAEQLSTEECLEYLSPENGAIILIESPDKTLSRPVIEISKNKLVVKPKTNDDIGDTSFLALQIMFENSEEIIAGTNAIVDNFTG